MSEMGASVHIEPCVSANSPRLRRKTVDLALALFLLSCGAVCAAVLAHRAGLLRGGEDEGVGAPPRLVCRQAVFDGGYVLQGETVRHTFLLTNTSDAPLTIARIRRSCACTTAELVDGRRTVAPGASIRVRVSVDSTARTRKVFARARLLTEREHEPPVVLAMQFHVVRAFRFRPERLDFGAVGAGVASGRSVELWCDAGDVGRIDRIESLSKHVRLEQQLIERPGGRPVRRTVGGLIRATLAKDSPLGRLDTCVRVWVKGRATPVAEMPVLAQIRSSTAKRSRPSVAAR